MPVARSKEMATMTEFMNQDFLLTTETARKLYHEVAADLPIIDYHSHLQ